MQTQPVFPQIIATGGLEAICGATFAVGGDSLLWTVGGDACLSLLCGSLDGPQTLPAGSCCAPGHQRFTGRG